MKAIDIIEPARSYALLSNEKPAKPQYVGNRIKLEFALSDIDSKLIIATSGDLTGKRCLVLIDLTKEQIWALIKKSEGKIIKLRQLKSKN